MAIEIVDVVLEPYDEDLLWGRHIDAPRPGSLIEGERIGVIGWVLGKAEPAAAVELTAGSRPLGTVAVADSRPDLAEAFPEATGAGQGGFRTTALLESAVDLTLDLHAVLESGTRVPLAAIHARRTWLDDGAPSPVLVSVIVTARNQATELAGAIESVLHQTYPHFELIVVDDGSTDHTAQVARQAPGSQVVQLDGKGTAAARNAGLTASSGSLVVFMDAADRLLPSALEVGIRELAAHPDYALVWGRAEVVGAPEEPQYPQQPFITHDHYTLLLQTNGILNHATLMYRRPVLSEVGVFDPELPVLSELDLCLRIARHYAIGMHPDRVVEDHSYARRADRAADMLAVGLETLGRQEPFVAGDPRREEALAVGRQRWADQWQSLLDQEPAPMTPGETNGHAKVSPLRRLRTRRDEVPESAAPGVGEVDLGDLRRTSPVSDNFGFDRGRPVDRYYIEDFLERHGVDIHGRVLEVQENDYTVRFGGDRVSRSDVIHRVPGNPRATLIGDLADPEALPADAFDCVILTQTLHLIYEVERAVENVARSLRDGGVLLLTSPGISQVEWGEDWAWSFTSLSLRRLLEETFGRGNVRLESHGNVLAATAFLQGLAVEDVTTAELDVVDLAYPVVLAARAVRR